MKDNIFFEGSGYGGSYAGYPTKKESDEQLTERVAHIQGEIKEAREAMRKGLWVLADERLRDIWTNVYLLKAEIERKEATPMLM